MRRALCLLLVCPALVGCGSAGLNGCTPTGFLFTAGPASSLPTTPDHNAMPPGNQEQFNAGVGALYGPGCATPQVLALTAVNWTVSDPRNVSISSASDATNGLATCLRTTDGAVTVTASYSKNGFNEQRSVSISCK